MITALVLMTVERGKMSAVTEQLLKLDGVSEVFSVAGRYDLIALLRTNTNEGIADLVTAKILDVPYITHTETMIAFKAFSKEDLGAMFSIGNDSD